MVGMFYPLHGLKYTFCIRDNRKSSMTVCGKKKIYFQKNPVDPLEIMNQSSLSEERARITKCLNSVF